jgi:hypothetical protein
VATVKAWRRHRTQPAAYTVASDFLISAHARSAAIGCSRATAALPKVFRWAQGIVCTRISGAIQNLGRTRDGLIHGAGLLAASGTSGN